MDPSLRDESNEKHLAYQIEQKFEEINGTYLGICNSAAAVSLYTAWKAMVFDPSPPW